MVLTIRPAEGEALLAEWRHVHNVIIPADPLSVDEVRARAARNRLDVAHVGDVLVGCSTVRPPSAPGEPATVIARVLPEHRRRGYGGRIYAAALDRASALGATAVETVVWAANADGLRFAAAHGFVEVERYVLPGAEIPYVTLRLR